MPIVKDGNGVIQYTPPANKDIFDQTGVIEGPEFAVSDSRDPLKQIQLDPSAQATDTTVTIKSGASSSDTTITLPASSGTLALVGGTTPGYTTIQTPLGTSPTATAPSETLTFTSGDSSITITGNASTDTIDIRAIGAGVTSVTASSPVASSGGTTPNITIQTASGSQAGALSSADWTTFNGKQAAGNYVTALTGDVTAAGPGSVAATVAAVGGSTASAVNSATVLANAATDANTASAIVKRDASGNFSAGTISAALTGAASANVLKTGDTMSGALNIVQASDAVHLMVKAHSTQTNNLVDFQNSAGTVLASVDGTAHFKGIQGTAASPSFQCSNGTVGGMYNSSTIGLTLAYASTDALSLTGSGVAPRVQMNMAMTNNAGSPGLVFNNDYNTGFYRVGANQVGFSASSTQRVQFDSSGVTAVASDLIASTAGNGIKIKEGTNARMGTATLVAGTATVSTTAVTANSRIFLTNQNGAGTSGFLVVSGRSAGTSFTITSSNALDIGSIAWLIIEPA